MNNFGKLTKSARIMMAWERGYDAYLADNDHNPFSEECDEHFHWEDGYEAALNDCKRENDPEWLDYYDRVWAEAVGQH